MIRQQSLPQWSESLLQYWLYITIGDLKEYLVSTVCMIIVEICSLIPWLLPSYSVA